MRRRLLLQLLLMLWLPTLIACGPASFEQHLLNYEERLARTLELKPTQTPLAPPPTLPRKRELRPASTPSGEIDLLDFLALDACPLQQLVAHRNSPLGRVAVDSQQLLYELEFINLGDQCIEMPAIRENAELSRLLGAEISLKKEQLGHHIWAAILGGPEWRAMWKPSQSSIDPLNFNLSATVSALSNLTLAANQWLNGDSTTGHQSLEQNLAILRGNAGGDTLSQLSIQAQVLSSLDAAIKQLDAPVCYSESSEKAQILNNVLRKYFIGEVQIRASVINRERLKLMEIVTELESSLAAYEPLAYKEWRLSRDQWLDLAAAAPRRHVYTIAPLLEECGLSPGLSE